MQVHFYLPERYLPDPGRQEAWKSGKITQLEEAGKIACAQCWIYQTWLALERSRLSGKADPFASRRGNLGCADQLARQLTSRLRMRVFFVGVVADYVAHPRAHLHLVQNNAHARRLWNSAFMPLWPHPNLLARDPARMDRFENVCFFGESSNLAPELADSRWQEQASRTNLASTSSSAARIAGMTTAKRTVSWRCEDSDVPHTFTSPRTKLYNAWLAGVPFIGGMDSAYAADGEAGTRFPASLDTGRAVRPSPAASGAARVATTAGRGGQDLAAATFRSRPPSAAGSGCLATRFQNWQRAGDDKSSRDAPSRLRRSGDQRLARHALRR